MIYPKPLEDLVKQLSQVRPDLSISISTIESIDFNMITLIKIGQYIEIFTLKRYQHILNDIYLI